MKWDMGVYQNYRFEIPEGWQSSDDHREYRNSTLSADYRAVVVRYSSDWWEWKVIRNDSPEPVAATGQTSSRLAGMQLAKLAIIRMERISGDAG